MNELLAQCPFCEGDITIAGDDFLMGYLWLHEPKSASCPLERTVNDSGYTYHNEKMLREAFTTRPIEDALRSELSDEHKRLEDAIGEITHLKDTRQDPYDQIEVMRSELDQLREQVRWRKYPDEKPELGKAYLVRYLFSTTYLTETPTADWISRGTFDMFGDGKWTVDSQTPLKVVIVTHFRELPQPPEEA